jgi:biotin carboxyl carrier protein
VVIDGITHEIRIDGLDHRRPAIPKASPTETTVGAGVVKAIMPGTIVRVFVTEGDSVNTGDVLLVLEAMKMENELQSPTAGVVKVIHVQPGDAVEMDAVLIEVESIVV